MEKAKKVGRVLIYSFFLVALFAAISSSGAKAATSEWQIWSPFTNWYEVSLQTVVANVINIAMMAAGLVAVIYLIIGGFKYVTSGGNAEAIEGAKGTILNAIIGLIVIFISFLLVNYILGALHIGGAFTPEPGPNPRGNL